MKIHGKIVNKPKNRVIVIPRGEDQFVFQAQAVLDYSEFDAICPRPNVPTKQTFGENAGVTQVPDDPEYLKKLDKWQTNRYYWMVLKSLEVTEGLEWSTIVSTQPETWGNIDTELQDAGFSALEVNNIMRIVLDANGLDQSRIDEATKDFLAMQAAAERE